MRDRVRGCLVVLVSVVLVFGPGAGWAQGPIQVITSVIGDIDCFGYGPPVLQADATLSPDGTWSPCGTLPGFPIQEAGEAANTDVDLACPGPAITFTHTFTIPSGATIVGAVWQINLGGVERSKFRTVLLLNKVLPVIVPNTGPLGTALVVVPLIPPLTSILADGHLEVRLIRSWWFGCDDIFVDYLALAIAVQLP